MSLAFSPHWSTETWGLWHLFGTLGVKYIRLLVQNLLSIVSLWISCADLALVSDIRGPCCHSSRRDSSCRFSYKVPYPKDLLTQCRILDLWWRVTVLGVLTSGHAASSSNRMCFRWSGTLSGHTRCVKETPFLFLWRRLKGVVGEGCIGCCSHALFVWCRLSCFHVCDPPYNLTSALDL